MSDDIIGEWSLAKAKANIDLLLAMSISERDPEAGHVKADDALCAFLEAIGHGDLVKTFNRVEKFYA